METIKVNMNPNPLDVQTIHASQNDNEAREWGFELHNNGDVIDASEITDQMVFKAYKGGTEQLLPENTSTPTTTPILADIQYPDGLRTDQYFTYRETPTTVSNKARIKTIKGNTIVWNQLVQNGNFTDTTGTGFGVVQGTVSYANNTATVVPNEPTDKPVFRVNQTISVANHRMLLMAETSEQIITFVAYTSGWTEIVATNDIIRVGNRNFIFFTPSSATSIHYLRFSSGLTSITIKNVMCFDLTQMGLDINDPSDFTSLFPLSYYSYNQGSLLSFNGNGIKTVGKNQVANIVRGYFYVGLGAINVDNDSESVVFYAIKGKTYVSSSAVTLNRNVIARCDSPNLVHGSPIYDAVNTSRTWTWTATWTGWTVWYVYSSRNEAVENTAQVEFGTTATAYEPYTSSTLSLPISTYFPTGMKSAGNVYDELTESKAITRIGVVDLGTLDWRYESSINSMVSSAINGIKSPTRDDTAFNGELAIARIIPASQRGTTTGVRAYIFENDNILYIRGTNYTDANAFKQAVSRQYLYYELATPTETSFTTASLVTENAEIPLSNEDGVLVGKCTEQLSENPGFIDAKIKLSDSDGECYSNKIQLHVERSPQ